MSDIGHEGAENGVQVGGAREREVEASGFIYSEVEGESCST
jgi:hypothetical protein